MQKEKIIKWFKAATVRALKTMAQTSIATIGTSAVLSQVSWTMVISTALMSGLLSILTSVAGLPEVSDTKTNDMQAKEI